MDIFGDNTKDREVKLKKLKQLPLMLTPMQNSTVTAKGHITNVDFHEEYFPFFTCNEKIIAVKSNFCDCKWDGLQKVPEKKKSNRGRKKKEKKKKTRKMQGSGESMNSQIMFTIMSSYIRSPPYTVDKHSKNAEKITSGPNKGKEKITKGYCILLFRNGNLTLPGVLADDMQDARPPLEILCKYLDYEFWGEPGWIEIDHLSAQMRNYKLTLDGRKINLLQLQKYCSERFTHLLNIHFTHVKTFLVNHINADDKTIDYGEFHEFLKDAKPPKNLYVNFTKLRGFIEQADILTHYKKLSAAVQVISQKYYVDIDDDLLAIIWEMYLGEFLKNLQAALKKDKDNRLSHIKYDSEKYPGFIIKIKTPNKDKPDKQTTIKLFNSGKINIDGANNRDEAYTIYYWLNALFVENRTLTYDPDAPSDDEDDNFSYSDDDSDE